LQDETPQATPNAIKAAAMAADDAYLLSTTPPLNILQKAKVTNITTNVMINAHTAFIINDFLENKLSKYIPGVLTLSFLRE
jgi:hypothetical protein